MKVLISQLKAKLSEYLNLVRRGQTVTVLDRKTPIARLVPRANEPQGLRIDAASAPPRAIGSVKGVRTKRPVDIVAILAESRRDR